MQEVRFGKLEKILDNLGVAQAGLVYELALLCAAKRHIKIGLPAGTLPSKRDVFKDSKQLAAVPPWLRGGIRDGSLEPGGTGCNGEAFAMHPTLTSAAIIKDLHEALHALRSARLELKKLLK